MNCEKCQELFSDLFDAALSREDELTLSTHIEECLACADVRNDLESIVGFCRAHRGEYSAPPNEKAMWLRIRNVIEAEAQPLVTTTVPGQPTLKRSWVEWMGRSWELSLPQLAASVAAIVLIVSLATAVGLRRWQSVDSLTGSTNTTPPIDITARGTNVRDRIWQQQQVINYWNQRVESNKVRWNPQMRETFDRNLRVIDQAVNDSLNDLGQNPHDEVSEEMLNAALNEKLSLLKEFADL
jgi:hypothetical protein